MMDQENMNNYVWYEDDAEPLGPPTTHVEIDEEEGGEDAPVKGTPLRPFSSRKKTRAIGFLAVWQ